MLIVKQDTAVVFFFFQAEDGIRDGTVTGVQTCALPISRFELRTVGPQAVVLSGSDRVPDSGSLGNRGHFGPIAAGADAREPFDQPDVTGCLPGLLQAIADGAVQAVQADVILPPLQQHGVSSSL